MRRAKRENDGYGCGAAGGGDGRGGRVTKITQKFVAQRSLSRRF